jgi:hypothetical protein
MRQWPVDLAIGERRWRRSLRIRLPGPQPLPQLRKYQRTKPTLSPGRPIAVLGAVAAGGRLHPVGKVNSLKKNEFVVAGGDGQAVLKDKVILAPLGHDLPFDPPFDRLVGRLHALFPRVLPTRREGAVGVSEANGCSWRYCSQAVRSGGRCNAGDWTTGNPVPHL